jgi:hypothetical protein
MNTQFVYFKPKSYQKLMEILEKTPLKIKFKQAIHNNVLWLVEDCLKEGLDPSIENNYAIKYAAQYGYFDIVKTLLDDERVNPRASDNMPIKLAFRNKHFNIVGLLLKDKRTNFKF